jgi:two-component system capsular synthesis sensor histidine kinase RcsC
MILVVDDDPQFLEQAKGALARVGAYRVLFAENGKRALDLLDMVGDQIGLVLIDLNLPDMNSFDVISQIRRCHPNVRLIAMTGGASDDVLDSAKVMGATGMLSKPLSSDVWKDIVNQVRLSRRE